MMLYVHFFFKPLHVVGTSFRFVPLPAFEIENFSNRNSNEIDIVFVLLFLK